MKLNKFLILSIFLIFICLMGAVSANENTTDAQIADNINVTFQDKVYQEDLGDIEIDLPQNASGYIKADIDDVEIYNENITDSHIRIPITIPEPKYHLIVLNRPIDSTTHSLVLFYNNITIKSSTFSVMKFNQTHDYYCGIPAEILKGGNAYQHPSLIFPSSANGTVEVYIDDELSEKLNTTTYTFLNESRFNRLDLGNHTVRILYSGDDYYLASDRTYNFTVVDMLIRIPTSVVLDHDDCVSAKVNGNADGVITVYIDGAEVIKSKLDKDGEFLYSLFDAIKCTSHEVEVKYVAKNFTRSKKASVNVSYVVDAWQMGSGYGDDNQVIVTVPTDFNPKLVDISIDGIRYDFEIDDSGWIELSIIKLDAGSHTLKFDFKGDSKYYPKSFDYNFTIDYVIKIPDWDIRFGDAEYVSLILPVNANGTLDVFIDDDFYKSAKMINGKASIPLTNLKCGNYEIRAVYSGNDFNVSSAEMDIEVSPGIEAPYEMLEGESKYITASVSNESTGNVIFKMNDKEYAAKAVNGKAKLALKNFKAGEYDIEVTYVNEKGENFTSYHYLLVEKPKYKISGAKDKTCIYTASTKYSVKITKNSEILKNVWVTFKIGKKTLKAKTNKKGIATVSIPKFKPGKYTINVIYKNVKVSKKLTVKHVLSLKTVKVKKSAKKLVLTVKTKKSLKGKTIKFKFNSKTFKAKVNKKGIAKITIKKSVLKKLKVGKTVKYQASYLKDVVVKKAKVKK